MDLRNILVKEISKSGGKARIVKVPENRRPTNMSLKKLNEEIAAQISANEAMRSRSMQRASRSSGK